MAKNVWQMARRPSGAILVDGSEQDLVLWVERATHSVRSMNLVATEVDGEHWLRDSFLAALENPMPGCTAGPPAEIQVDDQGLRNALQALVGAIPVTLKRRLDRLNQFYQMLQESLQEGPGFGYLEGTQVQSSEITELASMMVSFLEAQPFESIHADDVLRLEGLASSPLFVSVLGMSAMEYGLGIYLNREVAVNYLSGITPEKAAKLPALSMTLVTEDDCPALLDLEIRQQQWPCHPMGFPLLMRVDGDRIQPNSQEIRLAIDCMEAVCQFAETESEGDYSIRGSKVQVKWAQLTEPSPLSQLIFSNLASPPTPKKKKSKSKR